MQNEVIVIKQKELTRYDVLRRVLDGTISLKDAAVYMGVSYRRAIRLKKDAAEAMKSLIHRNRGKPAANRIPESEREKAFDPQNATPLANWMVYHEAFVLEQHLGSTAIQAVNPRMLQFEPYQLVPVMRALELSRTRLLLCDDVGLGKTIQAGLVMVELIARRLAHRILIVSPPGPLLEQWKNEMWDRFGLRVQVMDRAKVEEIRKQTERGSNPFDNIQLGLASLDFLRQDYVVRDLERTSFDIVVIDEAHHVFAPSSSSDRSTTQRRKLAEVLAARSDALLLLTATPHDGYDRSFGSLLELLGPCLVNEKGEARQERLRAHVIRRLKRHIVDQTTGQPRFKERHVIPRPVGAAGDDTFELMHRNIIELIAPKMKSAIRNKHYDEVLSLFALLKRSVSTESRSKARSCCRGNQVYSQVRA